jgi:Zn-dependent protease with chaperone function/tellurite resistance protein
LDFFQQQQHARRHTVLMVVLFVAAVAAIVALVDAVAAIVYVALTDAQALALGSVFPHAPREVYYVTTAIVLAGIAVATGKRLWELSEGGVAVADMVDARRVERDTQDSAERRLLNIVEEMALASGIAAPLVYVMEEQRSINAFAAGYSPNEATVIVTRGALDRLGRDELQGVIAHEFSHILNGDMRLNIRLLGVISGIVIIGTIGSYLMLPPQRDDGESRGVNTQIQIFLLGLALWLIGSIGVLAGRLIKAVISRQREFLADASAVQFTRNPDGIGGALFKISERGGVVAAMHAEELSHMCIAAPINAYLEISWLRSHPPIEQRIERILGPGAKYLLRDRARRAEAAATAARESPVVAEFASPLYAGAPDPIRTTAAAVLASVGRPSEGHVDFAQRLLGSLPADLRAGTQSVEGAKAVICALLLGEGGIRTEQLAMIGDATLASRANAFADALAKLDTRACMPLLGLVIPTLKVLAQDEREAILRVAQRVAEADRKITLREFALLTVLRRRLGSDPKRPAPVRYRDIDAVAGEATLVLSLLAQAGGGAEPALYKGMAALGLKSGMLTERSRLNLTTVDSALDELAQLAPLKKPLLIKACLEVVMADGKITVAEGELMRAVCAALDTPLPPILEAAPQEAAAAARIDTNTREYASEGRHAT